MVCRCCLSGLEERQCPWCSSSSPPHSVIPAPVCVRDELCRLAVCQGAEDNNSVTGWGGEGEKGLMCRSPGAGEGERAIPLYIYVFLGSVSVSAAPPRPSSQDRAHREMTTSWSERRFRFHTRYSPLLANAANRGAKWAVSVGKATPKKVMGTRRKWR